MEGDWGRDVLRSGVLVTRFRAAGTGAGVVWIGDTGCICGCSCTCIGSWLSSVLLVLVSMTTQSGRSDDELCTGLWAPSRSRFECVLVRGFFTTAYSGSGLMAGAASTWLDVIVVFPFSATMGCPVVCRTVCPVCELGCSVLAKVCPVCGSSDFCGPSRGGGISELSKLGL